MNFSFKRLTGTLSIKFAPIATNNNNALIGHKLAGLKKIVLLEEPQAVCYDWYARHQQTAADELKELPLILVCDVGGGTTDLSLIEASFSSQDELALDRIGVGEHLMLGGDNLDLALAHLAEQRFNQNKKLNASSLTKLIQQTRAAKESLLSAKRPEAPARAVRPIRWT